MSVSELEPADRIGTELPVGRRGLLSIPATTTIVALVLCGSSGSVRMSDWREGCSTADPKPGPPKDGDGPSRLPPNWPFAGKCNIQKTD